MFPVLRAFAEDPLSGFLAVEINPGGFIDRSEVDFDFPSFPFRGNAQIKSVISIAVIIFKQLLQFRMHS